MSHQDAVFERSYELLIQGHVDMVEAAPDLSRDDIGCSSCREATRLGLWSEPLDPDPQYVSPEWIAKLRSVKPGDHGSFTFDWDRDL